MRRRKCLRKMMRSAPTIIMKIPVKCGDDVNNYHMILDTTKLGIENCADILIRYFERVEII